MSYKISDDNYFSQIMSDELTDIINIPGSQNLYCLYSCNINERKLYNKLYYIKRLENYKVFNLSDGTKCQVWFWRNKFRFSNLHEKKDEDNNSDFKSRMMTHDFVHSVPILILGCNDFDASVEIYHNTQFISSRIISIQDFLAKCNEAQKEHIMKYIDFFENRNNIADVK
jgi:hypothetical protein